MGAEESIDHPDYQGYRLLGKMLQDCVVQFGPVDFPTLRTEMVS
jgi:hypothetical protein